MKAAPVTQPGDAGEVMVLLITRSTWETLVQQGAHEGISPGAVLNKALTEYIGKYGGDGVVEYLHAVANGRR